MTLRRKKRSSSTTLAMYDTAQRLGDGALEQLCQLAQVTCGPGEVLLGQVGTGRVGFSGWASSGETLPAFLLPLCGYAIHRDGPFAIDDLTQDPGMQRDPLVRGPNALRSLMGVPLRRNDGSRLGAIVLYSKERREFDDHTRRVFSDIAVQAARQIELRESVERISSHHQGHLKRLWELEALFSAAESFAIIAFRVDGTITVFNEGAERLLGFSAAQVEGQMAPQSFHSGAQTLDDLVGPAAESPSFDRAWDWIRRDGALIPVHSVMSAVRTEEQELVGYVIIARDLTDEKRLERVREDFVATVSHELRTPLTSIRGSLGLVTGGMAGDVSDGAQKLLSIAHSNCERLVNIVNDILDLSKLQAGRLELRCEAYPVADIIAASLEENAPYAAECEVVFDTEFTTSRMKVWVDRMRIQQVMSNLLSNAAKVSPVDGKVRVGATPLEGKAVRIWVRDHGPGIPDELRDRLFTRFASVGSTAATSRGGVKSTGLGLSIVKQIVEQHGGNVGFETRTDEGSTFYFDLPLYGPLRADG